MSTATAQNRSAQNWLTKLQNIQIGSDPGKKIKKKDLVRILQNLTTLVVNGVSIPQALDTILADATYKKYRPILRSLSETIKGGGSLSIGMKKFPATFPELMVHQVQVGERAGTIQLTLQRISEQLEHGSKMKSFIIKKMTYPMLLVVAGAGSVTFMLTCVIPTFQKMYEENGAVLPGITQFLIDLSQFMRDNGIILGAILMSAVVGLVVAFKTPRSRYLLDKYMLRIPLLGKWLRNMAILQFTETLTNLLQSGFNLVDALPPASRAVHNTYIRSQLTSINSSIRRGEKFSVAMERQKDLFPPIVKQLVLVGERTGQLPEVTKEIRAHLRDDIEKTTSAMLGSIEPVLTAGLAFAIGGILLAVYLPMFDMIGNVSQAH
ncbi:MAG: type II secretion system F family protein [Planctomycetota bacterium]|nr:MAG: type II secretion system F family protein [Planctomycetota bacterium]